MATTERRGGLRARTVWVIAGAVLGTSALAATVTTQLIGRTVIVRTSTGEEFVGVMEDTPTGSRTRFEGADGSVYQLDISDQPGGMQQLNVQIDAKSDMDATVEIEGMGRPRVLVNEGQTAVITISEPISVEQNAVDSDESNDNEDPERTPPG